MKYGITKNSQINSNFQYKIKSIEITITSYIIVHLLSDRKQINLPRSTPLPITVIYYSHKSIYLQNVTHKHLKKCYKSMVM